PFDYETLKTSQSRFYVGASNCLTGEPEFFLLNEADKNEFKTILSASCSLPLIAPVVSYKNKPFLDGGLADSIPYSQALQNEQNKAVIILTRPHGYEKSPLKNKFLFKLFYRKYPKVYEILCQRAENYNASLRHLNRLEKEGVVYLIRPETDLKIKRTENNPDKTREIYEEGRMAAEQQLARLKSWLKSK
ncbi:MAG TPA: patatin family protein, partial [Bacteroidales bacterium]|nr:patatin family protein [Bacteroidales bacterium]